MSKEISIADLVKFDNSKEEEIKILKLRIKDVKAKNKQALEDKLRIYKKELARQIKEESRDEIKRLRSQIKIKQRAAAEARKQILVNLNEVILGSPPQPISPDNFGWIYKDLTNSETK